MSEFKTPKEESSLEVAYRKECANREELKQAYWKLESRLHAAEGRLARYWTAIREAMNELGVPQPSYPAPVANAYKLLKAALSERAEIKPICTAVECYCGKHNQFSQDPKGDK